MKWQDDKYKELKFAILGILIKELDPEDGKKISVENAHESIDKFFEILLGRMGNGR